MSDSIELIPTPLDELSESQLVGLLDGTRPPIIVIEFNLLTPNFDKNQIVERADRVTQVACSLLGRNAVCRQEAEEALFASGMAAHVDGLGKRFIQVHGAYPAQDSTSTYSNYPCGTRFLMREHSLTPEQLARVNDRAGSSIYRTVVEDFGEWNALVYLSELDDEMRREASLPPIPTTRTYSALVPFGSIALFRNGMDSTADQTFYTHQTEVIYDPSHFTEGNNTRHVVLRGIDLS